MKLSATAVSIVLCCIFRECLSQIKVETFSSKSSEKLDCTITSSTQSAVWNEVAGNGSRIASVYTYDRDNGITPETPPGKYSNFDNNFVENTDFDLIIENVDKDDGGLYRCIKFPSTDSIDYNVDVEALPDLFTLNCSKTPLYTCGGPDEELASSLDCTCIATEVSPESLQLQWSIVPSTVIQDENQNAGDYFNLINEVTVMPTTPDGSVSCSVTGYESEGIDSNLISKRYSFASPTCTLEVMSLDDICTKAELKCECTGGMPDEYTYSFYSGNNSRIGDAGNEKRREVNIVADETFTFYCRGCNGVSGASSLGSTDYKCTPGTTILPTTTREPTTDTTSIVITINSTTNNAKSTKPPDPPKTEDPSGPPKPDPNGVVIGLSVVGSLIAVAVIVIIIIFVLKRWKNPTERKNDKTDGNGMPMSEAPEYAAVDKPLNSEPKPAPRSSQPPPNNSTEKQELQYADIDHSSRTPSNQIRQPAEAPTEYATVQSVIV